jgi:tetratricopeptide (TPR) repeat protein
MSFARQPVGLRLLLAILAPVVLLAALEAALRAGGFGYPTRFFIPRTIQDRAVHSDNEAYSRRFMGPRLERAPFPFSISRPKEPGVCRVVVLGESAAMGDPVPDYGLSRVLEIMLPAAFPESRFEVVNAALTAINSHVIRGIAEESARHQPDLFVVYMGNNEVIGPYGPGTIFQKHSPPYPFIRASLAAKTLKISQLLERLIERPPARPEAWTGMQMFLERRFHLGDPAMDRVYRHFDRNLRAILSAAHRAGAPVLLCTPVVNLAACPPFASRHRPDLSDSDRRRWEALYEQGIALEARGDYPGALGFYQEAAGLDGAFADLLFRMARARQAIGEAEEAGRLYGLARDHDGLRFRADSRLTAIVRTAAHDDAARGTTLVDAAGWVARLSADGVPGNGFFMDHVHFNFRGNYALARMLIEHWPERVGGMRGGRGRLLGEAECEQALAFTGWDRRRIVEHMYARFKTPPYTFQLYHDQHLEKTRRDLYALQFHGEPAGRRDSAAAYEEALARRPEDWVLHRRYADLLLEMDDASRAIAHLRQVVDRFPYQRLFRYRLALALAQAGQTAEAWAVIRALRLPHLSREADALNQLGFDLVQAGQQAAGMNLFAKALAANPNLAEAHSNLGIALVQLGRMDEAIEHYQKALRLQPGNTSTRNNLAIALARLAQVADPGRHPAARETGAGIGQGAGQMREALFHFEEVLRLKPDDPDAHFNLGVARAADGKLVEARTHFERALAARPESADAHYNLGLLLMEQDERPTAAEHLAEAIRLEPTLAAAHRQLGELALRENRPDEARRHAENAVLAQPSDAASYTALARVLVRQNEIEAALPLFEQSLRLKPDQPEAANDLAWLLATSENPRVRDAEAARRWAGLACALTRTNQPGPLDTLAAAEAAAGDFEQAILTARQALRLAIAQQQDDLRRQIETRLARYEAGQPLRDPETNDAPTPP